jgi:hypothetical protein
VLNDGLEAQINEQAPGVLVIPFPTALSRGVKNVVLVIKNGTVTVAELFRIVAPEARPSVIKVNVLAFEGLVVILGKGHKGQRLSARVAEGWLVVDSFASD